MIPVLLTATAPDTAMFVCAALIVMSGAFGVVLMKNPVHCALSLVVTLFGIAVTFVAQEAHFLAAVQVIVYAGAIVVLFLFVIMLLGVDRTESGSKDALVVQRPLALIAGLGTLGLLVSLTGLQWESLGAPSRTARLSTATSDTVGLADAIFTTYLLPFEATSVLLVIAVVGAVVLARRPDDPGSLGDDLASKIIQPSAGPAGPVNPAGPVDSNATLGDDRGLSTDDRADESNDLEEAK